MSSLGVIWLVARREIRERGRTRSFKVSTLVMLVIVVVLVVVPWWQPDTEGPEWNLAVAGSAPAGFLGAVVDAGTAVGGTITVQAVPADADVEALLAGDADAVLVDGAQLVGRTTPDEQLQAAVSLALGQVRFAALLADAGIDPAAASQALGTELGVSALEEDDDGSAEAVAVIGVIVLFIAINSYGAWVLTGVLEEKANRVVELIVAAVPPRLLLAGKVLGIGALGLAQLTLLAAVGVGLAVTVGVAELPEGLVRGAGWALVWFVLGFAFYAVGYAMAGSLVSRQEDAQSAATPMVMIVLAGYFVSLIFVAPDPTSTAARIVSLLPPFAPMAMPARIAAGAALWWEVALAIGLMLVAIVVMIRVAGQIYAHSLLQTGARVKFRVALRDIRAERAA